MTTKTLLLKEYTSNMTTTEKLQFQAELSSRSRSVGTGIALALLLGGLGAHKFYLRESQAGVVYALMGTVGWMLIIPPFVVAILSIVDACRMGTSVGRCNRLVAQEIHDEITVMRDN